MLSLVLRVLCEKEVDVNGDESVDERGRCTCSQNPFRNGTYHDELHPESKLVSACARPLLLVPGQKTTDQICVLGCALKRVRRVLCTAPRGVTSVRRALSAYINNAALQMHASGRYLAGQCPDDNLAHGRSGLRACDVCWFWSRLWGTAVQV